MKRPWDIFIGAFMVVVSVAFQAIALAFVGGVVGAGIAEHFNIQSNGFVWGFVLLVGLLFNVVTFYEFRRDRISKLTEDAHAGMFFLLPRGIYRIAYGREKHDS